MNMPPPPVPPTIPAPSPGDPSVILGESLLASIAALDKALQSKGAEADLRAAYEALTGAYQKLEPLAATAVASGAPDPRAMVLAKEYRHRSRQLRLRADKPTTSPADREEYLRRAAWYEQRAQVKASGELVMPHHLRTKLEQCEIVNMGRRAVAILLDGIQTDVSANDLGVFVAAVLRGRQQVPLTQPQRIALPQLQHQVAEQFAYWAQLTHDLLKNLGGRRDDSGEWDWSPTVIDTVDDQATASAMAAPAPPVVAPTGTRLAPTPGDP